MTALEQLTPQEYENLPRVAGMLGIPPRYHRAALTDFDDVTRTRAVQGVASEGVMLLGGVGSGKTHLAAALLLEAVVAPRVKERDAFVESHPNEAPAHVAGMTLDPRRMNLRRFYFATVPAMAQGTRDAAREGTLTDVLRNYTEPELLVLDDLGASRDSEFLEDALYLVVSSRYNDCKATIYTTNLSLEILAARIGERIVSRINGTCLILDLGSADRRAVA